MADLLEIQREYARNHTEFHLNLDAIDNRIAQRRKQIERLETRRVRLYEKHGSWIDNIIKPIAEEMLKSFPDQYYEIRGPFGLDANTSIHFYKKGITGNDRMLDLTRASITFTPMGLDEGKIGVKNYNENTGQFSPGTIGELNGMNYPVISLDETTTIRDLIYYMTKANEPEESE